MASYVVLARKWRPGQFADIVGQAPIVRTLMNAIRSERIHQAYLMTGSRGIGKTSIARIFAKAVRCESAKWDESWLKSCDQCSSCKEITLGNSVDVMEIDGASNNGVEAIREIRENAKFLPASGKRKIYIIDEVHMLTTAAFNALLKTLEEPPAHVIFIFATTEPHKIPATILSRCQRFDFRRVMVAQIQARLQEVTRAEKIDAEPAALALIARAAEGSMRDAMSLLDQVISYAGDKVTAQAVRESVGLIESQTLIAILRGIFERQPLDALARIEQAHQQGHDLRVLARGLIEYLHAALLGKIGAPMPESLELSSEEWKELVAATGKRELEELEMIFQVLHHGVDWIARSPQPKIVLDVLVMKCATAEALVYVDEAGAPTKPAAQASTPRSVPKAAPVTTAPKAAPAVTVPVVSAPAAQPVKSAAPAPANPEDLTWERYIQHVKQTRPLLASILENGACSDVSGQEIEICFPPSQSYYREQLQSRAYQDQLLALGREFFQRPVRFRIELREGGESMASRRERERKEREDAAVAAVKKHPIIMEAKSLFGGELGPIEVEEK